MVRALIELVITVLVVMVARAVLTSFLKSSANAFRTRDAQTAAQRPADPPVTAAKGGDLHKDPVCGTYVAESTPFRRQIAGQTFYYCSDACREKHALVAR